MKISDIYHGKKHDNILIIGTGPSVFYNIAKVKSYCKKFDPTIVGVNGALHGILTIKDQLYHTKDPNGKDVTVDCRDIDCVLPHILFTFLLRKDKNTVSGRRIHKDKDRASLSCDLFKHFILKHKRTIINRSITLLCPDDRACKIVKKRKAYGYKLYGQARWTYLNSLRFSPFPTGYTGRKGTHPLPRITKPEDIYDGNIKFKPGHGGEYLLAWVLGQKPKNIAIVGMCDFPNKILNKLRRGWFWLDRVREMPPKMSQIQSKIINFIKSSYNDNFYDLNFSPVKL